MNLSDFLKKREQEAEWLALNGFDNGNPETNGEYATIKHFAPHCGLFVDIGANVGDFIKPAMTAMLRGRVLAIEPNPGLINPLKEIVKDAGEVYNVALSDKAEMREIFIHPSDSTASSLNRRTDMMPSFHERMAPVPIQVKRLDDFREIIAENSKGGKGIFFKVDTEGWELPVLKGGPSILSREVPQVIMIEYSTAWKEVGNTLKEAWHFLDKCGYSLHRVTPFGLERLKFYEPILDGDHYCNYFAINRFFDMNAVSMRKESIASMSGVSDLLVFNHIPRN